MLATLALTFFAAKISAAPVIPAEMAAKIALASQQYGEPPKPKTPPPNIATEQQNSAKGLYLSPTDDIWVYAHAEDPQKDSFLRAWGSNGRSIPVPGDDPQAYSWSLLKWDISGFPLNSKIAEAQLVFTAAPDAGYTAKDAADAPLEARPVKGGFNEKDWDYAEAEKYEPSGGEGDIYGSASPAVVTPTEFTIVIDLLKGPSDFKALFDKAMKGDKTISLTIASRMDPGALGRTGVYKVYSKDATDPTMRPKLRLVFENPPKKGK